MTNNKINAITLDKSTIIRNEEAKHTINTTINEISEDNNFTVHKDIDGPYHMGLNIHENRLIITISNHTKPEPCITASIPFLTFRRVIKDYIIVCESYHTAINNAYDPAKIETIDMGRRGLHNEGADLIKECLQEKADTDYETCRKLFTILYLLHLR